MSKLDWYLDHLEYPISILIKTNSSAGLAAFGPEDRRRDRKELIKANILDAIKFLNKFLDALESDISDEIDKELKARKEQNQAVEKFQDDFGDPK